MHQHSQGKDKSKEGISTSSTPTKDVLKNISLLYIYTAGQTLNESFQRDPAK